MAAAGLPGDAERCPVSRTVGSRLGLVTVKALLTGGALRRLEGGSYRFCPEPDCDVVYFDSASGSSFRRRDLRVRVGVKESVDPKPLCYCFDVSLADLEKDAAGGAASIPAMIAAEVRAGHCACELRNPRGVCCLGDVADALRRLDVRGMPPRRPG